MYTFEFISILHGNVLLAKQRPWQGRKSGQLCGQVVEFMSVYGTYSHGGSKQYLEGSRFSIFLTIAWQCNGVKIEYPYTHHNPITELLDRWVGEGVGASPVSPDFSSSTSHLPCYNAFSP